VAIIAASRAVSAAPHSLRGTTQSANFTAPLTQNVSGQNTTVDVLPPIEAFSALQWGSSWTCAGRPWHDCQQFVPGRSCQCNSLCKKYGNCCWDYDAHCSTGATCASYGCEQFVSGRSCQCTKECKHYGNCCADYDAQCNQPKKCGSTKVEGFGGEYWSAGHRRKVTVYHQTSPHVCDLIMASNFRAGSGGLCGAAMYFALTPEATAGKAITRESHGGCMIEAIVDVGRQGFFHASDRPPTGKFQENCGGWNGMTKDKLHAECKDTILMSRSDGDEVVVFEPERILAKRVIPFKCSWMCRGACQKEWPAYCHRYLGTLWEFFNF